MNVLWFTWKDRDNPLAGGAEVVNEELAARLARDGHDVVFLTAGFRGSPDHAARRGFRIVRVGSRYSVYLAAAREYLRHFKGWPDLVIDECNTMPFFASYYTTGRQVLFFHMLCRRIWFYEFPAVLAQIGWLAEPVYLRLLKRNLPVITISDSTKQDLLRHGYSARNITIIAEGIELEPAKDLADVHKYDHPTVLSFGSVRPMKQILDQIKAFEIAKAKLPDLRLIVAGDASGKYGRKVSEYVTSSPYHSSITMSGRATPAQKLALMRRSHLILATSVKEGWGLTVTEAASQGTPAAAYDTDGLRDSVVDGVTGLLTRTNTPSGLADTIQALLSDASAYRKIQTAAWKFSQTITFEQSYAQFKQSLGI